ncbi:MAG: hypothetical protein IJD10_02505 [Clostridia bacterium]|nr:hypothetical protein [Clostridia bacterium]
MKKQFLTWLKAAGIRALKTVAQTAVAMIPVGVSITEVSWLIVLGTAALAGLCSLLTSIAGLPEVKVLNEAGETVNWAYDGEEGE